MYRLLLSIGMRLDNYELMIASLSRRAIYTFASHLPSLASRFMASAFHFPARGFFSQPIRALCSQFACRSAGDFSHQRFKLSHQHNAPLIKCLCNDFLFSASPLLSSPVRARKLRQSKFHSDVNFMEINFPSQCKNIFSQIRFRLVSQSQQAGEERRAAACRAAGGKVPRRPPGPQQEGLAVELDLGTGPGGS